jgi:hypothetical protein
MTKPAHAPRPEPAESAAALAPAVLALLQTPRWLKRVNIVAVAAAIAAATALLGMAYFKLASKSTSEQLYIGSNRGGAAVVLLSVGLTFAHAIAWGLARREALWPAVWRRWICVPLAASNAGTVGASMALVMEDSVARALLGFFVGATVGVVVWGPALLVTLGLFGIPFDLAEEAAKQGLSSEDRGERTVGVVAALVGYFGIALCALVPTFWLSNLLAALCVLAWALGTFAAVSAHRRAATRVKFLASVRAGEHVGFGYVQSPAGELLVRVSEVGSAYRPERREEALLEVQASGDVKAAPVLHAPHD